MDVNAPLKILLAEDNTSVLALLKKFLQTSGHIINIAENGQEAWEEYNRNPPDLLLTDINMPIMNGLELISKIREQQTETWLPIIVLSALGDEKDIINGLESGADDYLCKPINLSILRAKIKSMQKMIALQNNNNLVKKTLQKVNDDLEQEQIMAKKLADTILNQGSLDHPSINYWLCPAKHFSGDLITVSKMLDGKLYLMIADSAGHGLAASLPTLTIARVFYAMSGKGFTIPSIISEMNATTKPILPEDRFVAVALFSIDFRHKMIECWNGGLPPALLLNNSGDIVHEFSSKHLAVSILAQDKFDSSTEIYQWNDDCELIVYTDGVIEAEDKKGKQFGLDSLLSTMKQSTQGRRISDVKSILLEHIDAEQSEDDISIVSVTCCDSKSHH